MALMAHTIFVFSGCGLSDKRSLTKFKGIYIIT